MSTTTSSCRLCSLETSDLFGFHYCAPLLRALSHSLLPSLAFTLDLLLQTASFFALILLHVLGNSVSPLRALSRALFPCLTHDHLPQKEVLAAAADEDKHLFLQVRERKERTIKRERERLYGKGKRER
jgi:hypothetical protein